MELWLAVRQGKTDAVKELAENPVLREASTDGGYRAIHLAVLTEHVDVLQALLDDGALVDTKREDGWTALHHCAAFGKVKMASMLIEAGAQVDLQDEEGWTPLLEACSPDAPEESSVDMVKLLIDHGADVNLDKVDGATALHLAAASGNFAVAQVLTQAGALVDANYGVSGQTPLFVAASRGHANIVELLLEQEADAHRKTPHGRDPLMIAIENEHLNVIKTLIAHGVVPKRTHYTASTNASDEEVKAFVLFVVQSELADRLRACALEKYIPLFYDHNITSLDSGRKCDEDDLETFGISLSNDRAMIIESLSNKRSSLARLSRRLSRGMRLLQ